MTIALELPEPTVRVKDRSITARYDTGQIKPGGEFDSDAKIIFTITVSYSKAGINYFTSERTTTDYYSVSVLNETERENGVIGFMMGSGLGVTRILHPSNRFSRKKLAEIAEEWREKIEGWLSLADDQAVQFLDDREFTIREKILPYWNGEKAGLA